MKTCSKCNIEKSIDEFSKGNDRDGLAYWCKKCVSECSNKNYLNQKENNPNYLKECYQNNKENRIKAGIKYHKKYPEKANAIMRKCRKNNPERFRAIDKKHRSTVKYKEKRNQSLKLRRINDPIFRLNSNMSSYIWRSLKGKKNRNSWNKLVGYDTEQLKTHLESQFQEGMTWGNYGRWHVDHKLPRSLFNMKGAKSKGFKSCWALENLQPLWKKENLEKSNKIFL